MDYWFMFIFPKHSCKLENVSKISGESCPSEADFRLCFLITERYGPFFPCFSYVFIRKDAYVPNLIEPTPLIPTHLLRISIFVCSFVCCFEENWSVKVIGQWKGKET